MDIILFIPVLIPVLAILIAYLIYKRFADRCRAIYISGERTAGTVQSVKAVPRRDGRTAYYPTVSFPANGRVITARAKLIYNTDGFSAGDTDTVAFLTNDPQSFVYGNPEAYLEHIRFMFRLYAVLMACMSLFLFVVLLSLYA